MTLFVDADSCPAKIRDIILKAIRKNGITVYFVANRPIPLPNGPLVHQISVGALPDAADSFIEKRANPGDLVVTRDIPLAAGLVERGISVINDRGTIFDRNTIRERLSERDFMFTLRSAGLVTENGKTFGPKEIHAFASALQKTLFSLKSLRNDGIIDA